MLTSHCRCNGNFQEFCSQVLYECMSKDRPALLQVSYSNLSPILLTPFVLYRRLSIQSLIFHFQVYISFYTIIESMWEHLKIGHFPFYDSLFISSLKVCTECLCMPCSSSSASRIISIPSARNCLYIL